MTPWRSRAKNSAIYQVFDIRTDIRPTLAEIDLGALRRNADCIRAALGPDSAHTGLLAVLKADAYGHGAVACARALERGVWGFAVSLVEEGVELRRSGIEAPIVVLGCYYGAAHRDVVAYRLTPVLGDAADLPRFASALADLGPAARLGVHLKIDTGMSRLGVRDHDLTRFIDELSRHRGVFLSGLCTHLAEADGESLAPTEEQLGRLAAARQVLARAGLAPPLVHVANSAGAVRCAGARFDLVRPGIALYGVAPCPEAALPGLWPVMSLKSRVVALREVPPGSSVSYGGHCQVSRRTRVATVPIGYADGYSRRLSGQAQVLCGGQRCAVLGAVTMDMIMVDLTDLPEDHAGPGAEIVLLGRQGEAQIGMEEVARWAGTIPWEIPCAISKRVPRVYLGERRA